MTAQQLLVATDAHLRSSGQEAVVRGYEFYEIARDAGLAEWTNQGPVAHWVGRLVQQGYVEHGPVNIGHRMPLKNVGWADRDLQAAHDYAITATGHTRIRQIREHDAELSVDIALGRVFPTLSAPWLEPEDSAALGRCARQLETALGQQDAVSIIGAAKELVEVSARAVLHHACVQTGKRDSVSQIVGQAAVLVDDGDGELAKRVASTVHTIGELRNASGAQHGGHRGKPVSLAEATLAASSAVAVATFLLPDQAPKSDEN